MPRSPRRVLPRKATMSTKRIIFIALGSFLALALIGVGAWGFRVATSPIKGAGDAAITKNSAANWTAAQAKFEDLYAGIIAADRKLDAAAERLAANPDDVTLQQAHAGIQSGCISLVGDYNAEARKYLAADFKASDLPDQISNNDPNTDCEGTK